MDRQGANLQQPDSVLGFLGAGTGLASDETMMVRIIFGHRPVKAPTNDDAGNVPHTRPSCTA